MFKAKNSDVIDLDKYKAVKRPDSEFKLEKVGGVDCLILDSDNEENVENKAKPLQKKSQPDSVPTLLPSHKQFRQQTLFDSLGTKRQEKPKSIVSQPSTSKEPKQTNEERKMWAKIKRGLQSPSFKKAVVQDALLAFDKNGPKKRGPNANRPTTPEPSEFIKSNPHFKDNQKPMESKIQLTQYGYPVTPPRYWNIDFPSKSEQKELGLLVETDSPLFKKRRK